ncbi:nucleotidyl transferase AbiEii/AbiGii toxin family protein [Mucilaginibacter sp. cycad4]|uniref:nucleotidyl transferase AbiEii/AbiGii toxin family protein n=1 Tax=Mucilaginibacter sp. cycad4 TaxID=3342096 RepID=UPI002AAA94E3|nr:nucleotidyl transferase AbiEii/AbiGii toxin family protein [Mucilaginibacter gossypii]WPV00356.1 nucleotidyl transferase AbiEii/AbiGii toxin family protein [Mucilaginibacter gossypii]
MLYKETVEPSTLGLLTELMALPELKQFRLVGGTALSLLLGHRTSIDLDLFTDEPFDSDLIANTLSENYSQFTAKEKKGSRLYFTYINNVKVDFVHTFEKFTFANNIIEDIRFASLEEIIALKLNAIAGRGAKKDFWDLHELLNVFTFDEMFSFYQKRYPNNSTMMILKSITYFVEADLDADPHSFRNVKWSKIKKDILKTFNTYIQNKN